MAKVESEALTHFWNWLNNARLVRYLLLFALGWALIQFLAYFEIVFVIFSFAAILAFLLNHPVHWLERFMPRNLAVFIVFTSAILLTFGFIFTIGVTVFSQGQQLLDQAPELIHSTVTSLEKAQNFLSRFNIQINIDNLEEGLQEQAIAGVGLGLTTLQGLLIGLIDLILIAVITFFMMLDGEQAWTLLMKRFSVEFQSKLTRAIRYNLLGFFWGRLILSVIFSLSCFVVFLLLQVPYTLLLAAIAGIFDLIPSIGATVGVMLVALIMLPHGVWLSAGIVISCVLIQQIQENLLLPRIMQGSINMNPVVMFFSLLVGAKVAGLLGLFLAIPIAGVIVSLLEVEEMQG